MPVTRASVAVLRGTATYHHQTLNHLKPVWSNITYFVEPSNLVEHQVSLVNLERSHAKRV